MIFTSNIEFISKVEKCPFCNAKINAKGVSNNDVRDSMRILLNNIDNHLNLCGGEKRKNELVKVSINTKTTTLKNYVSKFDTNFLMIS
jgi:hypothetical protein